MSGALHTINMMSPGLAQTEDHYDATQITDCNHHQSIDELGRDMIHVFKIFEQFSHLVQHCTVPQSLLQSLVLLNMNKTTGVSDD